MGSVGGGYDEIRDASAEEEMAMLYRLTYVGLQVAAVELWQGLYIYGEMSWCWVQKMEMTIGE